MNKEQFKEIINQIKLISEYSNEYYTFGIDLFEGKYPILEPSYKAINLLFETIYSMEGCDWISWFMYECDFGENQMEAWDDGALICQNIDELFDYIEQYKICN